MALRQGKELRLSSLLLLWMAALLGYAGLRLWMQTQYDIDWFSPGAGLMLALLGCLGALAVELPRLKEGRRLGLSLFGLALAACGQELLWLHISNKGQYLGLGLLLLLAGAAMILVLARPQEAAATPGLSRRWEWVIFTSVLLLAAALRLVDLGSSPANWWFDEVNLAHAIQEHVLRLNEAPVYLGELVENPGAYLMAGGFIFKIFGVSLGALRALSAFYGWLALFPFYFLARRWLGAPWGLAALLIYSSMRWTLIPQRIAFMSSFALFWMLCAVYFYWKAFSTRRILDLLLAGLSLGATLHAYTPSRAVGPILILFSLLHLRIFKGLTLAQALAFAVPALLVAAPILLYVSTHLHDYALRAQQVSISNDIRAKGWGELWISFRKHLLMFNYMGDHQARHNLSFWPQLDYLSALAFAPALIWAHWRCRQDARAALLVIWFWVMLAQGILTITVEAPQANRTILVTPCVALLLAWFLRQALAGLSTAFVGGWPRPLMGAGLALLLAVPAFNAWEVFGCWAQDPATWRSFSPESSQAARRAMEAPQGYAVYATGLPHEFQFNGYERIRFLNFFLGLQGRDCIQLKPQGNSVPPCDGLLVMWGASDTEITQSFKKEFPAVKIEEARDLYEQQVIYLAAQVPYGQLPKGPALFFRP